MSRKKREGPGEINAGSMADIAFLLLIFFLVVTTMDQDEGILRQLPPPTDEVDPPEVAERNIFKVKVNRRDQLLVEESVMDITELKEATKKFYTNPQNRDDLPNMEQIDKAKCEERIQHYKQQLKQADEEKEQQFKKKLKQWEERKEAVDLVGSFKTLPSSALISLRNDRGTSYKTYIQVQNELTAAINELREEFVREHPAFSEFDSYDDLDADKREHQKYIKAVRQKIPKRISEAEPLDVAKD